MPDRYLVDRRGTPDPESSQYYVLDVIHDLDARIALWFLVNRYRNPTRRAGLDGPSVKADELERLLNDTENIVGAAITARQPAPKKRGRSRPVHK